MTQFADALSLSVSRKLFNDMEYYTNWDRTHVLNILGNYQISK